MPPEANPATPKSVGASRASVAGDYAARCLSSGEFAVGSASRERHIEALRALASGDIERAKRLDADLARFLSEMEAEILGTLP